MFIESLMNPCCLNFGESEIGILRVPIFSFYGFHIIQLNFC